MRSISNPAMNSLEDAALIEAARGGDREAFGQLVGRYQNLVCALAFSTCGDFARSQDLAQETFLAAWKDLRNLREPARFKSWLCGIARNLTRNFLRREGRHPATGTDPQAASGEPVSAEPGPGEQLIGSEEQALVWGALEGMPETYREPLVLFYREGESIAQVAQALELSEDAVKQRLSRGRSLLRVQVTALVEGTLRNTRPGRAFTIGVLAALPALAPVPVAAAVAGSAAPGAIKTVAALAWLGAILGPIIGVLGGALGAWVSIENTSSPRERRFMIRMSWIGAGLVLLTLAGLALFLRNLPTMMELPPGLLVALIGGGSIFYAGALVALILWGNARQRRIQFEEANRKSPEP